VEVQDYSKRSAGGLEGKIGGFLVGFGDNAGGLGCGGCFLKKNNKQQQQNITSST